MENCILCGYCCTIDKNCKYTSKNIVCDFIIRANSFEKKNAIFFCKKGLLKKENICSFPNNQLRVGLIKCTKEM